MLMLVLSYIDPGTGSLIVQILIAGIVTIGAFIKMNWKKVTNFFKKDKHNN